jgi:hypothetical protein
VLAVAFAVVAAVLLTLWLRSRRLRLLLWQMPSRLEKSVPEGFMSKAAPRAGLELLSLSSTHRSSKLGRGFTAVLEGRDHEHEGEREP